MKLSREIKAGIIAIVAFAAFIWGYNFLKGKNVLSHSRVLYGVYENVDGLLEGRPVTINGLQVGSVSNIEFLPDMSGKLVVKLEINTDFPISTNSILRIYGDGMMGDKSMSIDVKYGNTYAESGDTLKGSIAPGITTVLNNEVQPLKKKIEDLLISVDSAFSNISSLTSGENGKNIERIMLSLKNNLQSVEKVTKEMSRNSGKIDSVFNDVSHITSGIRSLTDSLNKAGLASTVESINAVLNEMDTTLEKLNNGDGSLSQLLNDERLYNNLAASTKELHDLLEDIKLNPKRYVHISVFGKKNKEYVKPENDTLQ